MISDRAPKNGDKRRDSGVERPTSPRRFKLPTSPCRLGSRKASSDRPGGYVGQAVSPPAAAGPRAKSTRGSCPRVAATHKSHESHRACRAVLSAIVSGTRDEGGRLGGDGSHPLQPGTFQISSVWVLPNDCPTPSPPIRPPLKPKSDRRPARWRSHGISGSSNSTPITRVTARSISTSKPLRISFPRAFWRY
jgi:hypothetical protein